jgi:type VI secretion system protein ImpA
MLSPEAGSVNDPVMFLSRLRQLRLVDGVSWKLRDLLLARGELQAEEQPPDEALIRAEVGAAGSAKIAAQAALVNEALASIKAIKDDADAKMKGGYSIDMEALTKELTRFAKFYQSLTETPQPAETSAPETATTAPAQTVGVPRPAAPAATVSTVSIENYFPRSRSEAIALLKKGAEYFKRQEPNSPIPQLVDRAIRISEMDFLALLQDIAPDAVGKGREILGVREQAENS